MATPHNQAEKGQIAKTVLMPGDPLRAKYIAENFLTEVQQFNEVRNMYGYTGKYQGREVSVMGSGMGMPSMGIYSYELYTKYDVERIIRIGSAGALSDDIALMDIVAAIGTCTDSNYASQYAAGYICTDSGFWSVKDYRPHCTRKKSFLKGWKYCVFGHFL